jgi:hypothetical protein
MYLSNWIRAHLKDDRCDHREQSLLIEALSQIHHLKANHLTSTPFQVVLLSRQQQIDCQLALLCLENLDELEQVLDDSVTDILN